MRSQPPPEPVLGAVVPVVAGVWLLEPAVAAVLGSVLLLEVGVVLGADAPPALDCPPLGAAGRLVLAGGGLAVAAALTELRPAWAISL